MSNHGGKRAGAGRKPGSTNKRVLNWTSPLLSDPAALKGMSPRAFMLEVMRDPGATNQERMEAAKSAAPYFHARPREAQPGDQPDLPLGDQADDWGDDLPVARPN